jgi:hypothetical protein
MTTKKILLDDASFTIETVMPSEVGNATSCKVSIYDTAGTALVSSASATMATADTTAQACTAGDTSVVLTTGPAVVGDVFRIGNAASGWQTLTVRHYATASDTITTEEFIDYSYPAGVDILWRNVSYAANTTAAAWDDLEEVTVIWEPQGIDAIPWTETWTVVKRSSALPALEQEFQIAFPRYAENIRIGQFEYFRSRAWQRIKNYFESRGRNVDLLIDSEMIKEPTLIQIALMIAMASSDAFTNEIPILQKDLDDMLSAIDKLPMWIDDNQDMIKTDEETQTAVSFKIVRGL